MDDIEEAGTLLRRLASFGATGDERPIEIADGVWPQFQRLLTRERLSGVGAAALDVDAMQISDRQREELRTRHTQDMTLAVALERALLAIATDAKHEGIDLIVLKGPAIAHTFYPDPSWRPFGDIDLLVRTKHWRRACALLDRHGFRRHLPEPRPGFDERFGKAAVHINEQGLNIDLHRTLVLGAFGFWMKPEELFERTVLFDLAGVPLKRLDDTALLLHACVHATLGFMEPLLLPVRDVVQIVERGAVDWDELARWAVRWRLRAVVLHAFQTAQKLLGVDPPAELAALGTKEAGRRERRALEAYITTRRARGGTIRSTFWAVRGLRAKAGLLRAMLLPDHAFLAARAEDHGSRPSYIRRWAVPMHWLLHRKR